MRKKIKWLKMKKLLYILPICGIMLQSCGPQIDNRSASEIVKSVADKIINETAFPKIFLNYATGIKGLLDSDFDYQKIQLYYHQPLTQFLQLVQRLALYW